LASVTLSRLSKRFGTVSAVEALDLAIADHEFISFLGPSGCGKTTTLNMIAGLAKPSGGAIHIGEDDVTYLPAMKRDIAMVFQSYALYPHMTVAKNLGFALRVRGIEAEEAERRIAHAAQALGLVELLGRYPRQLSGGQRQRVALGRALVRDPKVFLLDEPLSNLDAVLRVQTRAELKRLFSSLGTTAIYVTHDQAEAMTMSDRIAVFRSGQLQQVGTPLEVYRAPANLFVARFVGSPPMTFLPASIGEGGSLDMIGRSFAAPARVASDKGRSLLVGLRPEDVRLGRGGTPATIEFVEHLGSALIVHLKLAGQNLVAQTADGDQLRAGTETQLDLDSTNFYCFDPQTELALHTPGKR
jgi:multiple sugar transport system ATP-binding protein